MPRTVLLIDADNVSIDIVEQAVARLVETFGALHVRRAYCTAEVAVKHQAAYRRLGIRPVVNLASGKNCTDILLAVDALDLAMTERPDVVAIASSDSDFEPLVMRLREKGCRVIGLGQGGKTGADTPAIYDEFIELDHRARRAARAVAATPDAPAAAPAPRAAKAARAEKTAQPAKKPRAAKTSRAAKAAPPPQPRNAERPSAVQDILRALPELASGEFVELGKVAERLRAEKLLGRSVSSAKLLLKHPDHFELLPEKQPNRVRLKS